MGSGVGWPAFEVAVCSTLACLAGLFGFGGVLVGGGPWVLVFLDGLCCLPSGLPLVCFCVGPVSCPDPLLFFLITLDTHHGMK